MSAWTPERKTELARLWQETDPHSIARKMGISRHSLNAMANRMGLGPNRFQTEFARAAGERARGKLLGGLPGETADQRDIRIIEAINASPRITLGEVRERFSITEPMACRLFARAEEIRRERRRKGTTKPPLPHFTPSPPPPPTPLARLCALAPEERAAISARYGVIFPEIAA